MGFFHENNVGFDYNGDRRLDSMDDIMYEHDREEERIREEEEAEERERDYEERRERYQDFLEDED